MAPTIFHPAFQTVGGAEILVATQAQYLKNAGLDISITTLAFDDSRWKAWLDGIPVRVVPKGSWTDGWVSYLKKLQRTAARSEPYLRGCETVLACNFPANLMLGSLSIPGRRAWYCTEPSRYWHLVATNPRLHARVVSNRGGSTDAERHFARQLRIHERLVRGPSKRAAEIEFDIESTNRIDAIYSLSEFGRDNVRRVYGRTDVEVMYPIVRFPSERPRPRAGLDRSGLKILTHSRLEIPKNVDTVIRAFASFKERAPGAELHVVGEGSERPRLLRLAEQLRVGPAVTFHGYLPDDELDRVYDACDVFALLPIDEPFGMVFPEAAARGLLLVGPDHGGPFEILDAGRLGWVCDPFEPEAAVDAFARIWALSDAEVDSRRRETDRACRDRYSESIIGPQLLRAFERPKAAVAV